MRAGRAALAVALIVLLTALTQTGGLALLLAMAIRRWLNRAAPPRAALLPLLFLAVHGAVSLAAVPLARLGGRVPLSCGIFADQGYAPHTRLTCLLNRHYATVTARQAIEDAAAALRNGGGARLYYLDAGFPFFDGFPMLPHLSHRGGNAVDFAIAWVDAAGRPAPSPSPIGYFAYAAPDAGAIASCPGSAGWRRWDLAALQPLFAGYRFDVAGTRRVVEALLATGAVRRIFVEPHLKHGLGLDDARLRFQGCRAARHDDHLHVEFR